MAPPVVVLRLSAFPEYEGVKDYDRQPMERVAAMTGSKEGIVMAKLIGTNVRGATLVLELNAGVNSIGRSPANSLPLDEPSISSLHCEITVRDGGATIKDLHSTNGTFLDGQRIAEAPLCPGQRLQLGSLPLLYEAESLGVAEEAPEQAAPPTEPAPAEVSTTACRYHPRITADWKCSSCGQLFCKKCAKTRQGPTKTWWVCPICQSDCRPVASWVEARQTARTTPSQGFFRRLPSAFQYPLTRGGTMLLIGGTVLFSLADAAGYVVRFAFVIGLVAGLILTVFSVGYLFAYMQRILAASALGEDSMPEWPELTEWASDIIRPFLMFIAIVVVSFGPPFLLAPVVMPFTGPSMNLPLFLSLAALGLLYFPMALVAVAVSDNIVAVSPHVVLPAIVKIPGSYAVSVAIFFLLVAARWFGEIFLQVPTCPCHCCPAFSSI